MSLSSMPQELFDGIAGYLPACDSAALGQTCNDFHARMIRRMHAHAISPVGADPPLHWASRHKYVTLVKYLLHWLLVDQRDENHNRTALHIAVQTAGDSAGNSAVEVMTLLLAAGAKIEAVDSQNETPLLLLCSSPTASVKILELLLQQGANPNAVSNSQQTPLGHCMITNNHHALALALLQFGANPNTPLPYPDSITGTQLISPLHVAAVNTPRRVLPAPLSAGADINNRNYTGITPLHAAARFGSCVNVNLLIGAGADLDAANNNGETSLLTAIRHGSAAVAVQLLRAGANGEMANLIGITPMREACRRGQVTVVRELLGRGYGLCNAGAYGAANVALMAGIRTCVRMRLDGRGGDVELGLEERLGEIMEMLTNVWQGQA